ncbi:MAG TPA: beta-ketoacyl-ACP synthase II [Dehalococcoidia bacterium]|nr:beta-ketoacyl-ACP synthase II [Dehalococcoidia bacterium]
MKRRVVITGLGVVTPLGVGVEASWLSLCQGRSGIGPVARFDASPFRTKIAGEVNGFNPTDFMTSKLVRRSSRFIHYAIAAAQMAVDDAGLTIDMANNDHVGTSVGTAMGGVESLEKNQELVLKGAYNQISPFFIPSFICNMAVGQVAIYFGARGPNMCSVTACASGTHAVGDAFQAIQRGEAEVMIAGGSEAAINPVVFAGLDVLKVMSARNDEPGKASRPFDKDRDGFVISEGAAMVILEEMEFALERGARIYAEVLGYGHNSDAYHITAPDPGGEGAAACMEMALNDAAISTDKVDYINAHGTSTALNDLSETRAIKSVFGEYSRRIPVSANKSVTGHLWAGSGALEIVFSVLTIVRGIIPPTANYQTPDPECDLDYVPNTAREEKVDIVLSNSFGFGSTNGTLIVSRFPSP